MNRLPYSLTCLCIIAVQYCAAQDYYNPSQPAILTSRAGYNQKLAFQQKINSVSGEGFLQYALNNNNAFSTYIPWLYSTRTKELGLGDVRVKYIRVVKRNISNQFAAIQCGLQVNLPSGDKDRGLGSGRLLFQPFVTGIFRFSQKISFMPTVSYIHYISHYPKTLEPYSTQGLSLAPNVYYKLSRQLFFSTGANLSYTSSSLQNSINYSGNFIMSYTVNKWQVTMGCNANFVNRSSIVSTGVFYVL